MAQYNAEASFFRSIAFNNTSCGVGGGGIITKHISKYTTNTQLLLSVYLYVKVPYYISNIIDLVPDSILVSVISPRFICTVCIALPWNEKNGKNICRKKILCLLGY